MLKSYVKCLLFCVYLLFVSLVSVAQTNPVPFNLSTGAYALTAWAAASPAGTYPPNSIWHRTSTLHPPLAAATTGNYTGTYNSVPANVARIEGLGAGGFDFCNDISSNDHNLGAFVIGLNTTGRTGVIVTFQAAGQSIGSLYNVRLQYRITTASAWVDVLDLSLNPVEFVGTGAATVVQNFNVPLSTYTGSLVDNRSNMQLRWKYYWVSGAASLSKIRVDEINISSSAILGNYTSTSAIAGSPFCVTPTIGAAVTVPFTYEPKANFTSGTASFTAQLSNNLGSFAAPVNIGSVISNASGSQSIAATIPAGTVYGNAYRIRVISASPLSVASSDNYENLTIEPSPTDATGLSTVCATTTSTVSWTLPVISCFNEVIVVATPFIPAAGTPAGNGSAYTANAALGSGTAFGTGYVVYKGSGTSVVVSNLSPGTSYYFKIWTRYGSEWSTGQEVSCSPDYSTKVLINGYFNTAAAANEWTELIVTGDDVNMEGWKIRDNNGTQSSWQVDVNFNNPSTLWQHLRRGTVITLYHRGPGHVTDNSTADGYIQEELFSSPYFNGGDVSNSMNLNASGDVIELRDASGTHVHGMGHLSPPGISWTGMPSPKLNYAGGTVDGEAVSACPGGSINDYDGPSSTLQTSKSSVSTTFGLPNACASTTNDDFWRSLRQPYMTPQTVLFTTIVAGTPGSVSFSWIPMTDPYPADNLSGYIIVRNTSNSFPVSPSDGTTYPNGTMLGTATIVATITGSSTTTYTDNNVFNGNTYYYRVYAYRFNADDLNADGFNQSRGRAYNESNYVSVNWPTSAPLPVSLLYFKGEPEEKKVHLSWSTAEEKNNDYFLIEKSINGEDFTVIGKVKGKGNSTSIQNYFLDDNKPESSVNYYALTQVDFDGTHTQRKIIVVRYKTDNTISVTTYPNPFSDEINIDCISNGFAMAEIKIFDYLGKEISNKTLILNDGVNHSLINIPGFEPGVYFLELKSNSGQSHHTRIIKNR